MKIHKIIARRRGISIVEVAVALAIIMIVSAATTTLILRVSDAEGEVAHTMAHNERIENAIECYQWANGDAGDFDDAMKKLGYQDFVTLTVPTCTEKGFMTCTCSKCGDSYTMDIDPIKHSYDKGVVLEGDEPTCTEKGIKTYTCTNIDPTTGVPCGDFYTVEIEPIEHKYDDVVVTPPTCEERGYTTYTCTNIDPTTGNPCGHSYVGEDDYVDATGHVGDIIGEYTDTDHELNCSACHRTVRVNHVWELDPEGNQVYNCICGAKKEETELDVSGEDGE